MRVDTKTTNMVKRFASDQNGNTTVLFALALVGIVIVFGIAFDFSRALNTRTSLQGAADAAALAIARDTDITPANMQTRATDYFNANMQDQSFGNNYTITATEMNDPAGIEVNVVSDINTTFAGLVGMSSFDIKTKAQVMYSTTKVELVLALDNTGSMGSSNKIQTLRTAANDLVDQLLPAGANEENVKIGVIPFNYMVRLPTEFKTKSWMRFDYVNANSWTGCVAPRQPPHDVKDSNPNTNSKKFRALPEVQCPTQAITTLTNDRDVLHDTIDQMEASNWTYIPEGLAWGWRVLSKKKPVQDGVGYNDEDWTKILVLMTDGANTVEWDWPSNNPQATVNRPSTQGDAAVDTLCTRIKNKGIFIYTIAFKINNSNTVDMMEDCATEPGMFFDAENNAQLVTAFAKISSDITNLRLSR
ncbi:hypothetical protein MNBD_ALPHA06-851 [hydrothermal vent metagenome]|uniref:VWFA domain-containing protein n=1 Tax=hydrothermal vent metagenome TaxID=652676 RepID=A0A3B0RN71_9ZZZZ